MFQITVDTPLLTQFSDIFEFYFDFKQTAVVIMLLYSYLYKNFTTTKIKVLSVTLMQGKVVPFFCTLILTKITIQSPEELFECVSQTLLSGCDRNAASGWGATGLFFEKLYL